MVKAAGQGVHRTYVGVGVILSDAGDGGSHPDGVENGAVAVVIRLLDLRVVKGRREKYTNLAGNKMGPGWLWKSTIAFATSSECMCRGTHVDTQDVWSNLSE